MAAMKYSSNVGAEQMVLDFATLVAHSVGLISLLLHSALVAPLVGLISLLMHYALVAPSVVLISLLL
jgi:hypothetical protein